MNPDDKVRVFKFEGELRLKGCAFSDEEIERRFSEYVLRLPEEVDLGNCAGGLTIDSVTRK